MTHLADSAKLIAVAISLDGKSKATLSEIYAAVRKINPEWRAQYKDERSFEGAIRGAIECHCPQSEKWSSDHEALFEWMDRGQYRTVPVNERPAVIARGRL
jgi:hypothetical protein